MAESDSSQDRSEEPTAKKRQQAKEKGQVARSKELSSALVLGAALAYFTLGKQQLIGPIVAIAKANFGFDVDRLADPSVMTAALITAVTEAAKGFIGLLIAISIAALASVILLGGWNFSLESLRPKFSNLDPIKGLKTRVFSMNGVIELVKALLKFVLIGSLACGWLWLHRADYIAIGQMAIIPAIEASFAALLAGGLVYLAGALLIAGIDVPLQLYQSSQKLKMTKQEVRDEYKDSEGKPELKSRVRQLQREISQRKMMSNVPAADVVITNPTHFSVALKYDPKGKGAPIVIAKGADHVAMKIRDIARHHEILQVNAPGLCRAVFYTTEVDREIPAGLYKAVAQVLAFVYQMNEYRKGQQRKPVLSQHLEVPAEFKFNSQGQADPTAD